MNKQLLTVILMTTGISCLSQHANAKFEGLTMVGIETQLSTGEPIYVVKIYANFDSTTDRILGVTASYITASQALYQNPFGTATEPIGALVIPFPDLVHDSFVTMNKETTLEQGSPTTLERGSVFYLTGFSGAWSTAPDASQTTGQLSYLVAQISVDNYSPSTTISAQMAVEWMPEGGDPVQSIDGICNLLTPTFCPPVPSDADFDDDCVINGNDLAALLGAWGQCGSFFSPCAADLQTDFVVDGVDLAILLGWWGQTPLCAR